jgi:TPR repeat protein
MVESTRQVQSTDPFERFDEAINDPRLYDAYQYDRTDLAPYQRTDLAPIDPMAHEPVPLFLSDYEEGRYQDASEYAFANGGRRKGRASRIVTGIIVLSAAAGGLALYSMDSTRAVIVNAKASLASAAPVSFGAAQPETAPQQPRVAVVPPVTPELPVAPDVQAARRAQPGAMASASPTREQIAAAYQSALKSGVVAVEPAVSEPAPARPAARRIDPDELAALLKRAKGLLAVGDITAARLLLERAADAQEAEAALMLAGTYDPEVLGVQDMRSITPDPAMARAWYQKAAQLGSQDARRRLTQLQN